MPLNISPDHLSRLPEDVLFEIGTYLGVRDRLSWAGASHAIFKHEALWKRFFEKDYDEEYGCYFRACVVRSFSSYREMYFFLYALSIQEREIDRLRMICDSNRYSAQNQEVLYLTKSKHNFIYTCLNEKQRLAWFNKREQNIEDLNSVSYDSFKTNTLLYVHHSRYAGLNIFAGNILSRLPKQTLINWQNSDICIRSLFLCSNELRTVPEALFTIPGLKRLMLTDNAICNLPPAIAKATALTALSVGNNRLTHLPDELFTLTHLRYLRLGNEPGMKYSNQLTALPVAAKQLTNLLGLDLRYLGLQVFPNITTRLQCLLLDGNDVSFDQKKFNKSYHRVIKHFSYKDYELIGFYDIIDLDKDFKEKRRCVVS